jgi:hypothetical protein
MILTGLIPPHNSCRTGSDDAEDVVLAAWTAKHGVAGEDEGAYVQGSAGLMGDPIRVDGDEFPERHHENVFRDMGDAELVRGIVHAGDVLAGAEELDFARRSAVGLQALKDLLGVVEDDGAGRKLKRAVRNDPEIVPALSLVVIHEEHVIGKNFSEPQFIRSGCIRRVCCFDDFDGFHVILPSS